ncbi:MAG: endonuclease/exonuclease/phosphatase family protein [Prevotella sp.]|nr:endonuclease/exonuclease/phosphatase family protein [Prevotella sp.]
MKRQLILLSAFLMLTVWAQAQEKKFNGYAIGFYNLENLFDTEHDEGKNDYQFLPDGSYKWNELKYQHKLHNMAKVLSEMGTDFKPLAKTGCAVIGVSEVENARCMRDLCDQPELKAHNYQFVHIEGPDKRGVDCALIYQPSLFTVRDVKLVPYVYELPKDSARATRGFLTVSGTLADEHVAIIVNHWPSRFAESYYRECAARQCKAVKDSLLREDPNVKVIIMGDMNDDPTNLSMMEGLKCKSEVDEVGSDDMYNPWYNVLVKEKQGTLKYDGRWNLFDQIVLSPGLLNQHGTQEFSTLKYFKHQIFRRDYLFQTEGKYKGNTKRTHAGGVWLDGYSDHLPTVVYLMKEKK